ncbi:Uncharacterised protein [uncultured Flavonifractor sp.]|nr:Uncharacterised protein [uncultured Flavonifractor sp.]
MAYIGTSVTKTACYDRIVRRDGIWCVERNIKSVDLTLASWNVNSNYGTPYLNGYSIKDCALSYYPFCTHFASRGASNAQSSGIWAGSTLVIGLDALPDKAETTPSGLKTFCTEQAEAGTPVIIVYALATPTYEELHQDVQVLLNTLSVPSGTCSVWFEGDILPSGADIGLPRGDYPCSGVEGAYRWLEELSNPLPTPTTDDLYAWALSQQRGGVFATDGSTTTKNVPESGNLTGILFVTEQGSAVSMIVFGPTGKIHTAIRIAGVWRGWTTLYSPLSKPDPADLGAAAASHNHSADQITSGILPLARGGLGASTWSDAMNNLRGIPKQSTYYGSGTNVNIDEITDGLALVSWSAAKNCPVGGSFVYIMQLFYSSIGPNSVRTQIAFPFDSGRSIAFRTYTNSAWSEWTLIYSQKSPPPKMSGASSEAAGTDGLVPAPAAGAQDKFLRGDGSWSMPTADQVGAAAASHNHSASDITSGTLPVSRGGTGVNSLTGTDYGTYRVRGIAISDTIPSSMSNGQICLVY